MDEIVEEKNEPNLSNITSNKKRVKKREFNEFSLVTKLIKKYKQNEDNAVMLEIIKALEGIINTFTIITCPGDPTQQIYLNPYMKKFIGMFLTKDEQNGTTYQTYMQAVYRIRWTMRYWTYEDMYSELIKMLIDVVKKIQIIGDCDCIYYIQFVMKFKMHSLVVKTGKDIMVDIKEMPTEFNSSTQNDSYEETIERLALENGDSFSEDKLISSLYKDVDLSILLDTDDDVYKCFGYYEKYIIYLFNQLDSDNSTSNLIKKMSTILKETQEDVTERLEDIKYKIDLIKKGNF